MDKTERDAIRARCEAATPGPWTAIIGGSDFANVYIYGSCYMPIADLRRDDDYKYSDVDMDKAADDAEFIAHARQDIPELLDALEAETERANSEYITAQYLKADRDRWKARAEEVEANLAQLNSVLDDNICIGDAAEIIVQENAGLKARLLDIAEDRKSFFNEDGDDEVFREDYEVLIMKS